MENANKTKVRCFQDYQQHLEERYNRDGQIVKRWLFYVCGFSQDNTMATVLRSDGSEEYVSIDKDDRILICGRRYGRKYWSH